MIVGIGIDAVEIKRFSKWSTFSKEKLLKLLSEHEIEYCLSTPLKSAERFAARFAAREAFFKAFCQMAPNHTIPFLSLCKLVSVKSTQRAPELIVDWPILCEKLGIKINPSTKTWLSITHTSVLAEAIVIVEKNN